MQSYKERWQIAVEMLSFGLIHTPQEFTEVLLNDDFRSSDVYGRIAELKCDCGAQKALCVAPFAAGHSSWCSVVAPSEP
jgi:hypothetical protein